MIQQNYDIATETPKLLSFYYSRTRGAYCNWKTGDREDHFIANAQQLASALEDTGIIDTWSYNLDSGIYVTHSTQWMTTAEPLERFMSSWTAAKWTEFITAFKTV